MGGLSNGFFNTIGHNQPVTCSPKVSFKCPVESETCRMLYENYLANPAIGHRRSIRQQFVAYLPFSFKWQIHHVASRILR